VTTDRLTASGRGLRLRRRNFWEAADSGLLLWRKNFFLFLPFFAIPLWICAFALRLLPENFRSWSPLVLWFLKPLFDRPVLHIISVRFFEKDCGMKRLLRGFWKTIFRALPGDLLWRRFSPFRSAVMPVRILENVKSREAKRRRQALKMGGLNFGAFLTIWGIALSVVLMGGEILFSFVMIELVQENYISSVSDFLTNGEIFYYAAWCVNYMLVESIYVCMGFGVYINSRVEVEGWDIEILFRNIAEAARKKGPILAALVFIAAFGFFSPAAVSAAESPAPITQAPLETLEEIFSSGDFGGEKDGWGIRLKKPIELREAPDFDFDIAPWMEKIKQIFAVTLRVILAAVIAALAVMTFLYFRKNYRPKTHIASEVKISSHYAKKGERPELLLEKAQGFYARGEIRIAWGYCFSAAIGFWSLRCGIVFPDNATEYECLRLVRSVETPDTSPSEFADLVVQWAGLAYGGRRPGEGAFEKAIAHCKTMETGHA
jgi:hypothetical protein